MCSKKITAVVLSVIIFTVCLTFGTVAKLNVFAASKGDANDDGKVNVRDAAYIASSLIAGRNLSDAADYNEDGRKNIRDAAALVSDLTGKKTGGSSESTYDSRAEKIVALMNQDRAMYGRGPLSLNNALTKVANIRAEEIEKLFSHTRPDGSSCFTILDENNIAYSFCGENIAAGVSTPESVFSLWKNSQGHYENMMDDNFTQVGIGYFYSPSTYYQHYWVQVFRRP